MKMEILAVIPARGGSKGIPRKNLVMLGDKPLVAHTICAALNSKFISRVVVSTEDDEIAEVSHRWGADIPFLRPAELAKDDVHSADVVWDTLKQLSSLNYNPEIVIMMLPTAPLRLSWHVDEAIHMFSEEDCQSVIGVCELKQYLGQIRQIQHGYLRPIEMSGDNNTSSIAQARLRNTQRQDQEPLYYPNGSIYVADTQTFLLNRSFHLPRTLPYLMPSTNGIDVDTPEDLELVEYLYKRANTINML